ncbi:hypothetical protein IHE45_08G096800 [Dioscorea alata]|uniref:Uncharacterized protein n=1 Tax=Dioscorea alata TaxID=55571 RepID=A0ACB7VKN4_DIOAL|nr:hypothetical protein IHE45_08G096800 [Dioscorea alata]
MRRSRSSTIDWNGTAKTSGASLESVRWLACLRLYLCK